MYTSVQTIAFLATFSWFCQISTVRSSAPFLGIEDTFRDRAQETTISATAVAWISGDFCADTFLPPGKVADYFGFQYLRDGDACGMGHDSEFAAKAANVLLHTLNETQREWLIDYAYEEAGVVGASSLSDISFGSMDEIVYGRLPLQQAFREHLEGREGLSKTKMQSFSSDMYHIDGLFTIGRAKVFLKVMDSLNEEQKSFLDELGCMPDWPTYDSNEFFDNKKHSSFIKVLYNTYAGQLLSWAKGNHIADAYFAPERVANYFGLFYLKDISSIMTHNVTIDADATKDLGEAMLGELTDAQKQLVYSIVDMQRNDLYEYYNVRLNITSHLRNVLTDSSKQLDENLLLQLSRQIGKLDASITYHYATKFTELFNDLNSTQKDTLIDMRDLDNYPCNGAFYFSWNMEVPDMSPCFVSYFFDEKENYNCSLSFYNQTEQFQAATTSPVSLVPTVPPSSTFEACYTLKQNALNPTSVKITIVCDSEQTIYLSYGISTESMEGDTEPVVVVLNSNSEYKKGVTLDDLSCGVQYFYTIIEFNTLLESQIDMFTTEDCTFPSSIPSPSPTSVVSLVSTVSSSSTFEACYTLKQNVLSPTSVKITILCDSEQAIYLSYGTSAESMETDTEPILINLNSNNEYKKGVTLDNLSCGVQYFYTIVESSSLLESEIDMFTTGTCRRFLRAGKM